MTIAAERCEAAATEFNDRLQRSDGLSITRALHDGLKVTRDLLFTRVHRDVERAFGMDSMLTPISEEKSEITAKAETEAFQVAVAAGEAQQRGYVADVPWFTQWLTRLRFGSASEQVQLTERIARYGAMSMHDRRLTFERILGHAIPESRKAPLILLRLFPVSVEIVTAIAFGNRVVAEELRRQQQNWLASIAHCNRCHGRVLDNGESCPACGNPVWTFQFLSDTGG